MVNTQRCTMAGAGLHPKDTDMNVLHVDPNSWGREMQVHTAKCQEKGRHPEVCPSYQSGKGREGEFWVGEHSHLRIGQDRCAWKDLGVLFPVDA